MFKNNKYTKIYYQLIEKRKTIPLLKENEYCETHHIIPKSLGGSNDDDNLINLSSREHFIAHLLLTKMVIDDDHFIKMNWALHKMCYSNVDYFNSKDYEWYRKRHIRFLSEYHHSKRIPNWNQKMREIVISSWENNIERKNKTSDNMKKIWKGPKRKEMMMNNRKNAKLGGQASKLKKSLRLEYKGNTYVGWKELLELTGVSKFLYKKFYLKGLDPSDRIGKNGPLPKNHSFKPLTEKENP